MAKKKLRNNDERRLFVENQGNWEVVSEENAIRISVLKGTPFAKIEVRTFNNPMKHPYQILAMRNYIMHGGDIVFSAFPQDINSIVLYLREMDF
jgi:hypothetical protein